MKREAGKISNMLGLSGEKDEENIKNFETEYGKLIKRTSKALYYGGHKAYLVGGHFGDNQQGTLILTEKCLLFFKDAFRKSKRWWIVIPLDRIIIGDWKIDEKVRRKSIVGAGMGLGFGVGIGAGYIQDEGKSHNILLPYVDENGIDQAPRFGIKSFTGNAIREWAQLIYDVLVIIQKEKTTETIETETIDVKPLKVLKMRLAKGEITKEEFEELKGLID